MGQVHSTGQFEDKIMHFTQAWGGVLGPFTHLKEQMHEV